MNVFVINQYAGNKGDRAILYFMVRELARNGVSRITVATHDRAFWPGGLRVGGRAVEFVPWGWNVELPCSGGGLARFWFRAKRKLRREYGFYIVRELLLADMSAGVRHVFGAREFRKGLRTADVVISAGGHMIQTRFTPEAVSGPVYDMMLALLWRKPLVLWSQTIGPLSFSVRRNQLAVRNLLGRAEAIYVRDYESLHEVSALGAPTRHVRQTYDSVIGLNDEIADFIAPSRREPLVGLSVYSAEGRSAGAYAEYVRTLAEVIDAMVEAGHAVRLFPMEVRGAVADDRPCISDVLRCVRRPAGVTVDDRDLDPVSHLREVGRCRLFVGHKTHSQLFALTVGTPLLALAYHVKTRDFMRQYGLGGQCIEDRELTAARILRTVNAMMGSLDEIAIGQFQKSRELGVRVRADFAQMLHSAHVSHRLPGELRAAPTGEAGSETIGQTVRGDSVWLPRGFVRPVRKALRIMGLRPAPGRRQTARVGAEADEQGRIEENATLDSDAK